MSGRSTCRIISILTPVIVILACAVLPCGCLQQGEETGRFMGTVSVGPLCTVEPCTVSHDRLIAAYAARPITVTTSAGIEVATITANPETGSPVSLNPGTCVVDIEHQGLGGGRDLPATMTLALG